MRKFLMLFCLAIFVSPSFATDPDISANTTTASCADSVLNTNDGPANIEVNWEPNNIALHWYTDSDATTEMNVASASQSCTYDGTLNPPATIPTKTGYTFKGWTVRGVPDGYTRLEYIQTTGTQYIVLPVIPNASNIDISVGVLHTNGTNEQIFFAPSSGIQYLYTVSSGWRVWKSAVFATSLGALDSRHTFLIKTTSSGVEYYVNGIKNTSVPSNLYTSSQFANATLNLGARTVTSGGDYFWKGKIYFFNAKCDGSICINLIPAKRNSDNVLGMWDTVSKTFFTNAGTGTFTAGPALQ